MRHEDIDRRATDMMQLSEDESEGLEFLDDPKLRGDLLVIVVGLALAISAVAIIALIKAWPWISATVAGAF